jgi:hypothetical protein
MQILGYLLARFSEPSSYAGLGAVLALIGWNLPDSTVGALVQFLAAGCGLLALLLKDRGLLRSIALVLGIGGAAVTLSACGGTAQQAALDVAQLQGICAQAAPALAVATGPTAPDSVKDVAVYPKAFCDQISGDASIADQNSLNWLPQVLGYTQDAALVARFVLPVILPLL